MPPKYTAILLETKYKAITDIDEKKSTVAQTALELKVAKNTVYDWIRGKDKII